MSDAPEQVVNDSTPLPQSAIDKLSVRARHVLEKMSFPKTYGGIKGVTFEAVKGMPNAGEKTAREIMAFRDGCLNGSIVPDATSFTQGVLAQPAEPIRIDEPLPPLAVGRLDIKTRRILEKYGIAKTPRGICALNRRTVQGFKGAGKMVVEELMKLKGRCLDGSVWDDEVVKGIDPGQFGSLFGFVMAVAEKTCQLGKYGERIIADYLGLLNVERKKTLEEMSKGLGGLTRERVRQIAAKIEAGLFSAAGQGLFSEFVQKAKSIFEDGNLVVGVGGLVAGMEAAYPGWSGTTEFSVLRLLECYGIKIERNDSRFMAWMSGGRIEGRYKRYLELLEDKNVPLESLTQDAVLKNAGTLGLEGMTEPEFSFIVRRIFDNNRSAKGANKSRWGLFLRLRCGLPSSKAEKRRYVVARALREAGITGLSHAALVSRCKEIDPSVDIGEEDTLTSDANTQQKYDMDGTGARLLIYDFGEMESESRTHTKIFSLDVFFRDEELLRVIKEEGTRLRRHMERNGIGVASFNRVVKEMQGRLPEPYAKHGLPSACLYSLMREHEAGGLRYYSYPNMAHPDVVKANGGKVPERALSWVVYEYFLVAKCYYATVSQLLDFCEVMLGVSRASAFSTVIKPKVPDSDGKLVDIGIIGEEKVFNGEKQYLLKPPDETIEPPDVLLDGKFDCELSFCKTGGLQGMALDGKGKALNLSTYVRLFFLKLRESSYAFTEDEEHELADSGWCGKNLGPNKAVFVRAEPGSTRPSTSYWKVTFRVGKTDYWVSSSWPDKYKSLFDKWAQELAVRAGFEFEPYEIQREEGA